MRKKSLILFLVFTPFIAGAPSEERLPSDSFLELYNSTVREEPSQSKNVSKASMAPQPPQITIPIVPPNVPLMFPRPFSIPFPFPFPPPPPNFQFITVPRPQKNLKIDDDDDNEGDDDTDLEEEEVEELILPVEIPIDTMPEARRAPISTRRKKKQKKPKKQKKQKKGKKQKKQKKPKYPQPIIIYQNQEEQPMGNDNIQTGTIGAQGAQGAQSSYLGYYMVYVVEVRWTGNNYTQTVVTGRPIPAAITIPTATESGVVNNLSETIVPANLINGNRPQTTPTCLFQRSTTTEHFGTPQEVFNPIENTDSPTVDGDEVNENQEQIGEEVEDSEELDSVEDEYEDDSDPKKKKKKKKKIFMIPSTDNPSQ